MNHYSTALSLEYVNEVIDVAVAYDLVAADVERLANRLMGSDDSENGKDVKLSDTIRYYLMCTPNLWADRKINAEDFKTKINADLANNLGNLVNRTLNMTQKYFAGKVPTLTDVDAKSLYEKDAAYYQGLTQRFQASSGEERQQWKDGYQFPENDPGWLFLKKSLRENPDYLSSDPVDNFLDDIRYKYECSDFEFALYTIFKQMVSPVNLFIDAKAPWTLFKNEEMDRLAYVIYSALERIRQVAVLIYPVTPTLAQQIVEQLGYSVVSTGKTLLVNDQPVTWEFLFQPTPYNQTVNLNGILNPKLLVTVYEKD